MGKMYNDCDIALELLPLYIEKKTGEESNLFLEKHLLECRECQQIHHLMAQDLEKDLQKDLQRPKGQSVNQRIKRRLKHVVKKWLIILGGLVAYTGLMIGIIALVIRYLSGA